MVKTGIIRAERLGAFVNMPAVWDGQWREFERQGQPYAAITSFRQYFTDEAVSQLEAVFESEQEFLQWQELDMAYLDRSWRAEFRDYKQARERMKQLVADLGGFAALSAEERRIAAEWFVVPDADINSVLTFEERLAAGQVFDALSMGSRAARYAAAKTFLYNTLNPQDGVQIIGAMLAYQFKELYVDMGQEGTMKRNYNGEPDRAGLFDFVLSTPGSPFETAGIASFDIAPKEGFTAQEVIDRLMRILDHGNY